MKTVPENLRWAVSGIYLVCPYVREGLFPGREMLMMKDGRCQSERWSAGRKQIFFMAVGMVGLIALVRVTNFLELASNGYCPCYL